MDSRSAVYRQKNISLTLPFLMSTKYHRLDDLVCDLVISRNDNSSNKQTKLKTRREAMARYRFHKRCTLESLRLQESRLQDILDLLLLREDERGVPAAYVDSVQEQERLLREQCDMDATVEQYQKLFSVLKKASATTDQVIADKEQEDPLHRPLRRVPTDHIPVIIQQGIVSIYTIRCALTRLPEDHCFGWKIRRFIEVTAEKRYILRFRYTKRVTDSEITVQTLQTSAWDFVTSLKIAFESSIVIQPPEIVDSDTVVVLQSLSGAEDHRYFSVIKKMWSTSNGTQAAMVISRALDHSLPHSDKPLVQVKTADTCMRFTKTDGKDAKIEYVGAFECAGSRHASYMAVQTCSALCKWERSAISSPLLFASND